MNELFVEEVAAQRKGAIKIGPFGSALPRSAMVDDGFKVYGQENLISGDWGAGSRYVRPETFDSLRTCELHPGDVVMGMMGSLGHCEVFPSYAEPGLMDSHLLRIQVDQSLVTPEFLRHLLLSDGTARQLNRLSHGSIMAGLSSTVVRRLRLRVPPLDEQRRIAEILDTLDETIQATRLVIAKRRHLRAGLASDLFEASSATTPSTNLKPNGATTPPASNSTSKNSSMGCGQLRDLVDHITTKSGGRKPAGSAYVGLEHIGSGTRNLIGTAPSSVSKSTNGVFRRGDILFGKLRPNLRKAAQVDFDGYCSTDLLVLRPRSGASKRYAWHVASSEPVFRCADRNSIGTGMPRTSWLAVSQAPVWVPGLEEQRRIADILDTVDGTIRHNEAELAKLRELRVGLAADLLSGRVRTVAA